MWPELVIIIIVILISYIFTITEKGMFDKQVMFIIMTLFILVIYSIFVYKFQNSTTRNLTKENFAITDIDVTPIQTWLANNSTKPTATPEQTYKLTQEYSNVRSDLDIIKQLLQGQNAAQAAQQTAQQAAQSSTDPNSKYDAPDLITLASQQNIQNQKLLDIKDKIASLKNNLNQAVNTQNAAIYPKIPVYSSCIAEANGNISTSVTPASTQNPAGTSSMAPDSNNSLAKMVASILAGGVNVKIG